MSCLVFSILSLQVIPFPCQHGMMAAIGQAPRPPDDLWLPQDQALPEMKSFMVVTHGPASSLIYLSGCPAEDMQALL